MKALEGEELNNALREVAEYDGWKYFEPSNPFPNGYFVKNHEDKLHRNFTYHSSFDAQIPVWQKVYDKAINLSYPQPVLFLFEKLNGRIKMGTPQESFPYLVEAIRFIKSQQSK